MARRPDRAATSFEGRLAGGGISGANPLVDCDNCYCRSHRNVQVRQSMSSTPWRALMSSGTVKWFNPTKGYGFIQPQGGGQDVFVHISAVEKAGLSTLNEGQQVEFEIVSNRGKSSAENLKVK
jgi:CspA family cold shock protein